MVVLAIKKWGKFLSRKKLIFNCDNEASVNSINSGVSWDLGIQHCLRELHKYLAIFSIELKAEHVKGQNNRICDALSRWHLHKKYKVEFEQLTKDQQTKQQTLERKHWEFMLAL